MHLAERLASRQNDMFVHVFLRWSDISLATIAPVMISLTTNRVRVMIGFLVWVRVRVKIRIRVGVMFNVIVNHWSNCRRSKCNYTFHFAEHPAICVDSLFCSSIPSSINVVCQYIGECIEKRAKIQPELVVFQDDFAVNKVDLYNQNSIQLSVQILH